MKIIKGDDSVSVGVSKVPSMCWFIESSVSVKASPELKLEVFNIEEVIKKAIKSIQLSYNTRNGKIKTNYGHR